MPSSKETDFNRKVAKVLLPEYERETGIALRLIACNREFPDLVCQAAAGSKDVGIELVEVGLFFVNQESGVLRNYERRFVEAISDLRPAYKNTLIRLQIGRNVVFTPRPYGFPTNSRKVNIFVAEFAELLDRYRDKLLPHHGHLLCKFVTPGGAPAFPRLLECFEAVMVNPIPESYPGRNHPDDPVIDLTNVTQYSESEVLVAVKKAFLSKDKGASYSSELLVLHTLQADHKPYSPSTGMHSEMIVDAAQVALPLLKERFNEVWFLNAYWTGTKRLYRLK